jgi:hypothetical protein
LISWASAAGILFGACISALVSFILQRSSFAEARRQKDYDRREVRKALGLALVFKMMRLASQAWSAFEHLRKTIEKQFDIKLNFVRKDDAQFLAVAKG